MLTQGIKSRAAASQRLSRLSNRGHAAHFLWLRALVDYCKPKAPALFHSRAGCCSVEAQRDVGVDPAGHPQTALRRRGAHTRERGCGLPTVSFRPVHTSCALFRKGESTHLPPRSNRAFEWRPMGTEKKVPGQVYRRGACTGIADILKRRRQLLAAVEVEAPVTIPDYLELPDEVDDTEDELYNTVYDAVVIGSGMGGLATAAKLTESGAKVVVLEKYIIPGGSAGAYERDGFRFDVGSSMMFGLGDKGQTNLLTRCLAAVGKSIKSIPDPTQIHYHLPSSAAHPDGLEPKVWRDYDEYIKELITWFPHEESGIRAFYGDCWKVFNALNSLELKSLEEPRYLLGQFARRPLECLTLAAMAPLNSGNVARKYIQDEELLAFIDMECFCWSTVKADLTPMINAGMVFCDRHFGGVNYPEGGVGRLAELLAEGIEDNGGRVVYKANVKGIHTEGEGSEKKAVGVRLANGKIVQGRTIISNATRWDTFQKLLPAEDMPPSEKSFLKQFRKSPSFFTLHLGVKREVLPADCQCHHVILEDWAKLEDAHGTLFVSIPTVLDPSLSPDGTHIIHAFTPDYLSNWKLDSPEEYDAKKEEMSNNFIRRLEVIWPGLKDSIVLQEVATPRTQRRFLSRSDGTYGPIPRNAPLGMLSMPLNSTAINGLYCTGDSTFPGQGVNAVVFSGFGCAHRVLCDIGMEQSWPLLDKGLNKMLSFFRHR